MSAVDRLREISERLGEIAAALSEDSLDDARAVALADEAARLTGEAVGQTEAEVERVEKEG